MKPWRGFDQWFDTPDAGDKPPLPRSMSSQNIAVLMQCYAALSQERRPKRRDGEWVALFVARVEFSVMRWELAAETLSQAASASKASKNLLNKHIGQK